MHKPIVLVCACSFVASTLVAQKPPDARSFLPTDYRNVVFVDLAAIRKKGVWDELEASVLKAAFKQIEKESGFELKALDRMTAVAVLRPDDGDEALMRGSPEQVFVLEGNAPLGVSTSGNSWGEERIGAFAVRVLRRQQAEVCVAPKPEVRVTGSESIVRPVLEGKPNAGLPSADVMSLVSGRSDSLAYFVFEVGHPGLRRMVLGSVFPDAEWPEAQAPTFLCVRVLATGDADDPHLAIEAVLRHAVAGPGMDVSAKAADAMLERLAAMPEMRALKPVLAKVEKKRDRGDLVYSVDLGRVRDAIGKVAMLAAPLFLGVGSAAEVERVVPVEVPAPQPKK